MVIRIAKSAAVPLYRDGQVEPESREHVVEQARDVLPGRHSADRSRQHVVEQQRGYRQLRHRAAHRLLDDPVHAATDEHRGALDVDRSDRVREQHHAEDEPRRGLADRLLGDAADVVGRRAQVRQDNRGRAPERDEGKQDRGGENDLNPTRRRLNRRRAHPTPRAPRNRGPRRGSRAGVMSGEPCASRMPTGLADGLGPGKCPRPHGRYAPKNLVPPRCRLTRTA